jgi:tetratricopeptide (TPR) repeat protein
MRRRAPATRAPGPCILEQRELLPSHRAEALSTDSGFAATGEVRTRPPAPLTTAPPLPRWPDASIEIPSLKAQLRRAELARDVEREKLVAASLARSLVKRQRELDVAVRLGRRAVLLGDDSLRAELALWHCQLGQLELAVGMLTPLLESPGLDRSRLLMRTALYWARLGRPEDALAALREASAYSPGDPLIHELLAMVYGWAPRATSAIEAADAYLRGALCREQRSDGDLAFEDMLRAFDIAPQHSPAARALAQTFEQRGHARVADEIWRRHADALGVEGVAVHRQRLERALGAEQYEAALAAALDARLDANVDGHALLAVVEQDHVAPPPGAELDWLLKRLGLSELLAARLELAAEAAEPGLACRCRLALGRFADRVLGSTERAVEHWLEAVVVDPDNDAAKIVLRHYAATTGDHSPLIEAFIRVAEDPRASNARRLAYLYEIRLLGEQRLGDAGLALWALGRARSLGASTPELDHEEAELGEHDQREEAELASLERELSAASGPERASVLRRLISLLRGRPERAERYRAVLWELVEHRPDEVRARRSLERLLAREGDSAGLVTLWTRDLASHADPTIVVRALLGLSRIERSSRDLSGALAVLAAADHPGLVAAAAMQAALAAQLGNGRLRAEGLLRLLGGVPATLRALVASVASAELFGLGEKSAALAAAELATHADPSLARAVVAYAESAAERKDRVVAVAYERAMALTVPSSAHCKALVQVLDQLGDAHASERWTARWLGLRPSDTAAATQLIALASRERDAARLGDVMAWAIAQAHPLRAWENELARALEVLAEIDPARAGQMAWRLLDAFGPEPAALGAAVRTAAEKADDLELKIAALERELAAAEPPGTNRELLWQLVMLHRERGDSERAYAVLARAHAAGVAPEQIQLALELTGAPDTAEGQFYRLQVLAQLHERTTLPDPAAARALREHGAALWDLAKDREQATAIWLRAAELDGDGGWERFAQDLADVMGQNRAFDEIGRIAEKLDRPAQAAALLTGAGRVALERGTRRQALSLGLLALDSEPSCAAALSLVESAAGPGDAASLSQAYAAALGATLGRYGERALNYRAARFFEQQREPRAALTHAIEAFRAVPSEGSAFAMMQRLADSGDLAHRAAHAVEDVARRSSSPAERSAWLRRAALIVGRSEDGAQQRVEVLLRALVEAPDPELVALLGRAFTDLGRQKADGRQIGLLRFERAVTQLLPRLDPMDGSRVAIAMASVALSCFGDEPLALKALAGAAALDPESEEFADMLPDAERLGQAREAVQSWLDDIDRAMGKDHRASVALLDLTIDVAAAAGLSGASARFLTLKSQRVPEDSELHERAEQAVRQSRDPSLPGYVLEAFPAQARRAELLGRAEQLGSKGDRAGELQALKEALTGPLGLPRDVLIRLIKLAGAAHDFDLAEQALGVALASDLEPDALVQLSRSLASVMLEQRSPQRALKLLEAAIRIAPDDVSLLTQALAAARAGGEDQERRRLLARLIELTSDPIKKRLWFSEAWEVAKKAGDSEAQAAILRRWLESDPEDTTPLLRLEADCEAREAWAELAELLGQHLALPLSSDERRRLGLKRSYLLEIKLGQLEAAKRELITLCEQLRGDREVVERLAQVTQQLGDRGGAAGLWLSASALQATPAGAAEFAARSTRMFLDSGDFMSARRVLASPQSFPRTLELLNLAARLEREGGNEPRLARALEELGSAEEQATSQRAAALLEAASLWHRLNELARAVRCASLAADCVPHDGAAQLMAAELEYRLRGAGTREDALRTIERLRGSGQHWTVEQRNLAGFLLGEALEVAEGGDTALRELYEHERFGPVPLVSAAIAERLAKGKEPKQSLAHFELALRGDLRGLFQPSRIALSAARAAFRAHLPERSRQYLALAETDGELREPVARLREQLAGTRARSSDSFPALQPGASERGAVHGGFESDDTSASQRSWGKTTRIGLGDLAALDGIPYPPQPRRPSSSPPRAGGSSRPPAAVDPPLADAPGERAAQSVADPAWSQLTSQFQARGSEEESLFLALFRRSLDAGKELAARLEGQSDRSHDLVLVARMLAWLTPGEEEPLAILKRAAEADGDAAFSLALSHVVDGVLRGKAEEVGAPPLDAQVEQPQNLRSLLFADLAHPAAEALSVIWQSAGRVLCSHWAVSEPPAGSLSADGPLAATYFQLARLLGMKRTPLLVYPDTSGRTRARPVLAAQPAVAVEGDEMPGDAELAYTVGAALAGTLPASVLLASGSGERETELFRAIAAAFGPTEGAASTYVAGARLAELLWESVPPRAQRRLTELCAHGALTREEAQHTAGRAAMRAGLFASADLALALARCLGESAKPTALAEPGALAALCREHPAAADLVRLATSPQYAEARFRSDRGRRHFGFLRRVK